MALVRWEIDDWAAWPSANFALALPRQMIHAVRDFFYPEMARPDNHGIDVPPMSESWLRQYEADHAKRRDAL